MSDHGNSDDLWANTGPQDATPSEPPPHPPPPPSSTPPPSSSTPPSPSSPTPPPQPTVDPTQVLPVTPAAGGVPPISPPNVPPTGGGGSAMPPTEPPPPNGRGNQAAPVIAALMVGGLIAAIVVILLTRGDGDSVQTVDESTTTVFGDTTLPTEPTVDPATTVQVDTTVVAADTTVAPETTGVSETTTAPTVAPDTTQAPETTAAPDTTAAPTTTEPPGPEPATSGTIRVDGVEYGIERSCFTVPLAPNGGDLQVFSQLIRIDGNAGIVEQWFDEGGITGGTFTINGRAQDTGELLELDAGYAIESPAGSGDFSVVANPSGTGDDCVAEQSIAITNSTGERQYQRALVDGCFTANDVGESTVIGYASERGYVVIRGASDGTFTMTYSDFSPQLDNAPADVLGDASTIAYEAVLDAGTVTVITEDALLRDCTSADLA